MPAHRHHTSAGFGEIEIAVGVGLEAEVTFILAIVDDAGVVEVFVEVGLAVAVEIVQAGDLVAAEDVDFVIDDFQSNGLI